MATQIVFVPLGEIGDDGDVLSTEVVKAQLESGWEHWHTVDEVHPLIGECKAVMLTNFSIGPEHRLIRAAGEIWVDEDTQEWKAPAGFGNVQ